MNYWFKYLSLIDYLVFCQAQNIFETLTCLRPPAYGPPMASATKPHGGRARGRPRAFNTKTGDNLVQSLDRALVVLKTVAAGGGLSLTEIAEQAGQSPSTAYRLLLTLQKHDMVEFDEQAQLWHTGIEAFRIGSSFLGRTRLVEQARPVMQRLMTTTGETANLAIIDREEVVFISQVETHEPIRAFFRPGTRGPVHASGIGKALLAFLPDGKAAALIDGRPLDAFTPGTITDPDLLRKELRLTRERGWSVDDEERTLGMRCIASPIFDQFGEAIAGVSLSGPTVRVGRHRDAEFGELVSAAAADITRAIGGRFEHAGRRD